MQSSKLRILVLWLKHLIRRAMWAIEGENHARLRAGEKQGRVTMGPHSRLNGIPMIRLLPHDDTRLTIGDYSSIAEDAYVIVGGGHPITTVTTYPPPDPVRHGGRGPGRLPPARRPTASSGPTSTSTTA